MVAIANAAQYFRTPAVLTEQVIHAGPCILYGIAPDVVTTGTITIRDSATAAAAAPMSISAIGLPQVGKQFGQYKGVLMLNGITVQLSVATDLAVIQWEAC